MKIFRVPQEVSQLYQRYREIPVPYYMSSATKTIRPKVTKGKGHIDDIQKILEQEAVAADKAYALLEKRNIGIDCSGFVTYLLDAYTMQHLQKHVWNFYARKTFNPLNMLMFKIQPIVSMMNADTLTSKQNTIAITSVRDALPMDLIRLSGGKHVAMVYEVLRNDNDAVEEITYIHSTQGIGVIQGKIKVTDQARGIQSQEWEKGDPKAVYDPSYLIRYHVNNNGLFRPHFLSHQKPYVTL